MDFNKLNIDYTVFWQKHSIAQAISTLKEIDFYLSGTKYDTFLLPYADVLKPENLITYVRIVGSTKKFKEIADSYTYQQLINVFSNYLESLINNIVEYKKRLEAESKLGFFKSIVGSFASILSIISNKTFIFAIVGIFAYNLLTKK